MRTSTLFAALASIPCLLALSVPSLYPRSRSNIPRAISARTSSNASYCPGHPAPEHVQRKIFYAFINELYIEKNVIAAFDKYIALNLTEHDPFDEQGRIPNEIKLSNSKWRFLFSHVTTIFREVRNASTRAGAIPSSAHTPLPSIIHPISASPFFSFCWENAALGPQLCSMLTPWCPCPVIPFVPSTVLRQSFDNNIGFIHVRVDEANEEPIALADIYRMDGTCIVEHWDVTQSRPANATNPIAMF